MGLGWRVLKFRFLCVGVTMTTRPRPRRETKRDVNETVVNPPETSAPKSREGNLFDTVVPDNLGYEPQNGNEHLHAGRDARHPIGKRESKMDLSQIKPPFVKSGAGVGFARTIGWPSRLGLLPHHPVTFPRSLNHQWGWRSPPPPADHL